MTINTRTTIAACGGLLLCVLIAACARDLPDQSVPPPGARDQFVRDLITALDSGKPESVTRLLPEGQEDAGLKLVDDCGSIDPLTRSIPDTGDIVPYSLTVYMSGESRNSDETLACLFHVRWVDGGTWSVTSKTIDPSDMPPPSPSGDWFTNEPAE